MSKMRKRDTPDTVKKDFHDAIDRLVACMPKHKDLKAKAAAGKLKLNMTNIAIEAKRAPALLWRDYYADVRQRVEYLKSPKPLRNISSSVCEVRKMKHAREEQIADAKRLWTETMELHARNIETEQVVERFRDENERLKKDAYNLRAENAMLRNQLSGGNINIFSKPEK